MRHLASTCCLILRHLQIRDLSEGESSFYLRLLALFFSIFIALVTALLFLPSANAATAVVTSSSGVNLRSSPNGRDIGGIGGGSTVEVLATRGNWLKVRHNGRVGYIWKPATRLQRSSSTTNSRGSANGTGSYIKVSGSSVNIRSSASFRERNVITSLGRGETLELAQPEPGERVPSGMSKVIYQGRSAYISSNFTRATVAPAQGATPVAQGSGTSYVEVTGNGVAIRSGPNSRTTHTYIDSLDKGALLEIDDSGTPAPPGWQKVKYNGKAAYITTKYTNPTSRKPELEDSKPAQSATPVESTQPKLEQKTEEAKIVEQPKQELVPKQKEKPIQEQQQAAGMAIAKEEEDGDEEAMVLREGQVKEESFPETAQSSEVNEAVQTEAGLQSEQECQSCRNQNFDDLKALLGGNRGLVQFPTKGDRANIGFCGSHHYLPDLAGPGKPVDNYANPVTACVLMALMQKWKKDFCPNSQSGCRIQWGDISHKTRKIFNTHKTHKQGHCIDFRPFRRGGFADSPMTHGEGSYDRLMTAKFIQLAKSMGADVILFNDPELRPRSISVKVGRKTIKKTVMPKLFGDRDLGVRRANGHDNHLHICYNQGGPGSNMQKTCDNFKYDSKVCGDTNFNK